MKNKIITSPMNDRNGSVGTDNNEMFLIKLKKIDQIEAEEAQGGEEVRNGMLKLGKRKAQLTVPLSTVQEK